MNFMTLLKQPSGFLPIAMSVVAIAEIIIYLAFFGITQQGDEGVAARIFQLLILLQLPIMAYFTAKWLPRFPKQTIPVIALQVGAVASAIVFILILEA